MKKIDKLTISNFRNIKNAEYILGDRTAIKGKNHIGKTNALQALYWVLTDSMLENTSDFDTIVPHDDNRALTEVKLTFDDGSSFSKMYREKWTKTRGTDTETLSGHETTFYSNGVPLKTKNEATAILRNIILGNMDSLALKYPMVNMAKLLTNPLYLFGQEEWKSARQFIISLVGDVKDTDIFTAHPEYGIIREDLASVGGHAELLSKKYNDTAKALKLQYTQNETNIDFTAKKMTDNEVSEEAVRNAKKELADYEEGLKQAKEQNVSVITDPYEKQANNELTKVNNDIMLLQSEIATEENEKFQQYTDERQHAMNDWQKEVNKANDLQAQIAKLTNGKSMVQAKIDDATQQLDLAKQKKQRLLDQYREIQAREFHFSETVCPHCGAVLNMDDENKAKEEFEKRKNEDQVDCVARGRATATDISRLEAELEAYRRQLAESSDSAIMALQNEYSAACQKRDMKRQYLDAVVPYRSPKHAELDRLVAERDRLKDQVTKMATARVGSVAERVCAYENAMKERKEQAQSVIDRKTIYDSARGDNENLKCERTIINHNMTVNDEKREALKQFIVAKLNMINESTAKVFPDIEFTLLEPNIKEGSFNEVCYPLIKGKKTPFINGSNSERIMTGIAIINDIRKFLGIEPVCLIFDEGETLDSETIASIDTDAQVVTSMVCDDYAEPTAVLIR